MENWQEEIIKKWTRDQKTSRSFVTDPIRDRLARELKAEILYHEPMGRHTSIRLGGPADVFIRPTNLADLQQAIKIAREEEIPVLFQGCGSNTLVKDGGFRGFVIVSQSALQKWEVVATEEETSDVLTEAGVGITAFVNLMRDRGLSGMEALVGIPGTMGGAMVMNAGARGLEIKDILREVTWLDKEGTFVTTPREKLEFSYRHLKIPLTAFVVSGLFRLINSNRDEILQKIKKFQKLRVDTQPIHFPNLGSIFKNPPPPKKGVPVSAGQLIEEAGLKNIRVGGARISEKHANFIINENNASCRDVLILIHLIKDKVKEKTGIFLETEIKIVGEDA